MNQETTLRKTSRCKETCEPENKSLPVKPEYRVQRRDDGVTLRLALPGVAKDKVQISLEQGLLSLTADRQEPLPESWKVHRPLSRGGQYRFAMQLHPDLDPSSVTAKLADGILTLEIERHEAAKPRAIEVS